MGSKEVNRRSCRRTRIAIIYTGYCSRVDEIRRAAAWASISDAKLGSICRSLCRHRPRRHANCNDKTAKTQHDLRCHRISVTRKCDPASPASSLANCDLRNGVKQLSRCERNAILVPQKSRLMFAFFMLARISPARISTKRDARK